MTSMLRQLPRPYAVSVLLPTLVVLVYLGLFADKGYVSRAAVVVERETPLAAAGAEIALGLLNVGGGVTKRDVLVVQQFMHSRTMLDYLDDQLDLRGHFSQGKLDPWSRLDAQSSGRDFLNYFRDRLHLQLDEESLVLGVEFAAFEPKFAQEVVRRLVRRAEEFVNEISRHLAREQLSFVEAEVDKARQRLRQATRDMIVLQRKTAVFSPEQEGAAIGQILAGLEVELAKQRTQLRALMEYLHSEAPDVIATRQRIQALEDQVAQERLRLVGSDGDNGEGLNQIMLSYQDAEVDARLAAELYQGALATFESTKLDAARKVKYLVSVDQPSRPDEPELPRVGYWGLTLFVFLNLIYFVAHLIVATIRDHKD